MKLPENPFAVAFISGLAFVILTAVLCILIIILC